MVPGASSIFVVGAWTGTVAYAGDARDDDPASCGKTLATVAGGWCRIPQHMAKLPTNTEVAEQFAHALNDDFLVSPGLAVRLGIEARRYGERGGLSEDEIVGTVTGGAAMYRALMGPRP